MVDQHLDVALGARGPGSADRGQVSPRLSRTGTTNRGAPRVTIVALRREVRRLGSNLNQAMKLAHQGGSPDLQAAVEDLRAAVEKVLTR